ncbi:alpha/beta hydrolase family esterase [Streptomyces sp. NPDC059175]|uniref:alpha/beta hydrolase family esterase n=1 Tax=Streptomyces sp. NPDC059175 TaxID=3346757 RepID=UPI003699D777
MTPLLSPTRRRPARRGRTLLAWGTALALGFTAAGCGTTPERTSAPSPFSSAPATVGATAADTHEQLHTDGGVREYVLHRPTTRNGTSRPLVIAFHGRGSSATGLREQSRLNAAADARGMLVAYPEGLRKAWGAGNATTGQRPDPDTDVRFTESLVAELVRTEKADPRRVYVIGFSNGGSMALRMAAQRPALLAGAASVAGQLPSGHAAVKPTGAVPVMIIYGAEDPVRPLAGLPTPGPAPAGEEPVTPTSSAKASAEAFAAAGRTGAPATTTGTGYDRTVWGGTSRAAVQLIVVHGGGHTWPGSTITPPQGFGRTSSALNATSTILDFFAARAR